MSATLYMGMTLDETEQWAREYKSYPAVELCADVRALRSSLEAAESRAIAAEAELQRISFAAGNLAIDKNWPIAAAKALVAAEAEVHRLNNEITERQYNIWAPLQAELERERARREWLEQRWNLVRGTDQLHVEMEIEARAALAREEKP